MHGCTIMNVYHLLDHLRDSPQRVHNMSTQPIHEYLTGARTLVLRDFPTVVRYLYICKSELK